MPDNVIFLRFGAFFRTLISVNIFNEEFDPGSGLTLAVCLIHASRAPLTLFSISFEDRVRGAANG